MQAELKAKWIAALRSGEFSQAKTRLRDGDAYCCLGVLCQVSGGMSDSEWESYRYSFAHPTLVKAGLYGGTTLPRDSIAKKLADMNDMGKSFAEIADYIEREISAETSIKEGQ